MAIPAAGTFLFALAFGEIASFYCRNGSFDSACGSAQDDTALNVTDRQNTENPADSQEIATPVCGLVRNDCNVYGDCHTTRPVGRVQSATGEAGS